MTAISALIVSATACNSDGVITPDDPTPGQPSKGPRPVTSASKKEVARVFEWTPAPGQFINDPTGGTEWPDNLTAQQAADRALERFDKQYTVSLGAFGGYIVAGFDHSVLNTGGNEIGIYGNAFINATGNSNEPGIVYVMQDTNGNGLPDDTWYELAGSDTFKPGTRRQYAVTYFRPSGNRQSVSWTDNFGNSGEVRYNESYHSQPTYFPVWIKADSYTLSGTCLEARNVYNEATGNWDNNPYEWGYADNMGSDNTAYNGHNNLNRFSISNAIDSDGKPVVLPYIDFVKVQTGVNASSGWLGELSTEIAGIIDLTFPK